MSRIRTCSSLAGKAGVDSATPPDRDARVVPPARTRSQVRITGAPVRGTVDDVRAGENTENKLREWIRRYLPCEIAGTIAELGGAAIAYQATGSLAAAAII